MAFTCGFFNSQNGDRKYNAEQMASIFDGLIKDGVYDTVGDIFAVTPGTGMQVLVGSGRAWFDHTWNNNDAPYPLAITAADVSLPRYDAVVLETNHSDTVRTNRLRVLTGIPASNPVKPTMTSTANVKQHPLAYIKVTAGATAITQSMIQVVVGTSECPFVTGIIDTAQIDALFQQWNGEFNEWFENLKAQLSDNVVANLQAQIDKKVAKADVATTVDIEAGTSNTKWVSPKGLKDSGAMDTVKDLTSGKNGYIVTEPGVTSHFTDLSKWRYILAVENNIVVMQSATQKAEVAICDLNFAIKKTFELTDPNYSGDETWYFRGQGDSYGKPPIVHIFKNARQECIIDLESQKIFNFNSHVTNNQGVALSGSDYVACFRWSNSSVYTINKNTNTYRTYTVSKLYRYSNAQPLGCRGNKFYYLEYYDRHSRVVALDLSDGTTTTTDLTNEWTIDSQIASDDRYVYVLMKYKDNSSTYKYLNHVIIFDMEAGSFLNLPDTVSETEETLSGSTGFFYKDNLYFNSFSPERGFAKVNRQTGVVESIVASNIQPNSYVTQYTYYNLAFDNTWGPYIPLAGNFVNMETFECKPYPLILLMGSTAPFGGNVRSTGQTYISLNGNVSIDSPIMHGRDGTYGDFYTTMNLFSPSSFKPKE